MNQSYDVIVVGSGPAGSSAAWRLAQSGLSVAVIEKESLPRYKTCGGGIVGRAMQTVPLDVRYVVEQDCHAAQLNLLPAGLSFTTHRPTPIVSMTMRDQFDFALLSAAQAVGAVVHQRCLLEDVACLGDVVRVETSKGTMRAKFVVAADGAFSSVARKVGIADGRVLIPALEYEVTVPQDQLDAFHGVARFDFGMIAHGYAWAFPKKHHLSVGLLSMTQGASDLKREMAHYLDQLGCGSATQVARHGFVIPIRPREGPFVEHRVLLVGDAAGFADPVTGEGISFAIRSGLMAAKSLVDGTLEEEAVRQAYTQSVDDEILPELRAGRRLARLLYDVPWLRSWAFSQQGQRLCEVVTDVIAGTRRYQDLRCSLGTLFRWLIPGVFAHVASRSAPSR